MASKIKIIFITLLVLTSMLVTSAGVSANGIEPPTVTKTVSPTDISLSNTGPNDTTTVQISVTGAGGTSTTTIPMDVVFALDSSGSMQTNDPTGLRKTASKDFIDLMDYSRDYAGVVSWDSGINFVYGLSNNFATVKSKINNVDSSGGTNLNGGLTAAISMLDASPRTPPWARVIVFLTDGVGSYTYASSGGPASIAASKGYVIYSIGLGSAAMAPLNDMANATGGQAFNSPTAANLQAIFNAIFTQVINSTVPHNVDVVEVTQSYIQVIPGSFNITPSSVTVAGSGETTIIWNNIGMISDSDPDFSADETVTLTFDAKSTQSGQGLDVQVGGVAKIKYSDKDGNPAGEAPIPQAKINVNSRPTADAGTDQTVEQTSLAGTEVILDGSGSSDPDGDSLEYFWGWNDGQGTAEGVNPTITLPLGTTEIFLKVDDGNGGQDDDSVVITVEDTTAPDLAVPPVVTVEQESLEGTKVDLSHRVGDICDPDPQVTVEGDLDIYPLGATEVTFTATDFSGNTATATTIVMVEDTTAPKLSCVESVNPHGNVIPGKNRGKNGTPQGNNPDGFYEIGIKDICDAAPVFYVSYVGAGEDFEPFGPFDSGTVIKFTQAPGAPPSAKKIGSSNGKADAVYTHITVPGEPLVIGIDASGNQVECGECLVPPPPK
ncbi:VWA domain-containing protein [Chloroflexota bacterium]